MCVEGHSSRWGRSSSFMALRPAKLSQASPSSGGLLVLLSHGLQLELPVLMLMCLGVFSFRGFVGFVCLVAF